MTRSQLNAEWTRANPNQDLRCLSNTDLRQGSGIQRSRDMEFVLKKKSNVMGGFDEGGIGRFVMMPMMW